MSAVAEVKEGKAVAGAPAQQVSLVEMKVEPAPPRRLRRAVRVLLMLTLPAALVAGGAWFWATGGRFQETENANVQQAKVTIASEIAGRIIEVKVADNASVKAGDVLFVVEPEPYRIALAQADAALEAARLNVEQLRAAYSQATTQMHAQEGEGAYLKALLERQSELAGKGFSAKASLDESRQEWQRAEDKRLAAAETVASARAALGGNPGIATDKHPTVLAAQATRDKAAYALSQTTVRAPADGIVSQASSFRVGQFVGAGTSAFSLVETGDTWIAANFKETQLTNMRAGQEAEIVLDTYPDRVFHARIEAIGAGTGAEFSLLPAQNATGNWVKVTQRIPVRLKLDDAAAEMALRTGMSATVSVDTGVSRGFGGLFGTAVAGESR